VRKISILFFFPFLISACGAAATAIPSISTNTQQDTPIEVVPTEQLGISPTQEFQASSNPEEPRSNPRSPTIGEYSFSQLLPFDGIRPVYDPEFASPTGVEGLLEDDELVLGISLGGEAKAYPISVLRFREMVNDEMAGIPTLVTW
jgi:hypothetical protein